SGFDAAASLRTGPVPVDPALVVAGCEAYGDRLALAIERRERVLLATGHPIGLAHFYMALGRFLAARGVEILRPCDGLSWKKRDGRRREIRYLGDVAVITDRTAPRHTHSPEPMARILEVVGPDLVLADHGWAGAAIERGVETLAIADVNDPALIVARAQGRVDVVLVMDDNVRPEDYWPCFQAIVSRLPA
ncbi:MAG: phosphatase, partial [Actinomycetota bacterium]